MAKKDISKVLYYPGCTLHQKARHLDQTVRESGKALGIELVDLSSWTCCGAAFPLATDNKMGLLAPTRTLATAAKEDPYHKNKEEDNEVYLTTLCAFCYNVLKRTNKLLKEDDYKLRKINEFLEENYQLNVKIKHFLEILHLPLGIPHNYNL